MLPGGGESTDAAGIRENRLNKLLARRVTAITLPLNACRRRD